ncbi:MAG: hypothetical protein GYA21_17470 [Myxococcales bacterium]|nr:hypothetical protein [Myxococcales bacterium]
MSVLHLPVGKKALSGYLDIRPRDEGFFGAGSAERELEVSFGESEAALVRLRRAGQRLQLAYTGPEGEAFRRWLRVNFRTRRVRGPRGVLVLQALGGDRYQARAESLRQAQVEELYIGERVYLMGARPRSLLNPAIAELDERLGRISLPPPAPTAVLRQRITEELVAGGWITGQAAGGGLLLEAGLRRSGAELHLVLEPTDLYPALLRLAAGFSHHQIDLGAVLVADGALAQKYRSKTSLPPASLERAKRDVEALPFLVQWPLCLFALSLRRTLKRGT